MKAKLFLENLNVGDMVEIFLDDGEPIGNVPRSLENNGQEILEIKRVNNYFSIKVKKLK
ncbi:sulfurtransferase TusA family protein [Dictyoglomus sp.]|uniref:sulfurtransferase TusA family protein n=1 Tax=Dictyoglomus sp. TaxID=28205 RepID=UPI001F5EBCA1|nr:MULTISPECIES: sulfurtransferase TusA family protein [Dictyoglomus]